MRTAAMLVVAAAVLAAGCTTFTQNEQSSEDRSGDTSEPAQQPAREEATIYFTSSGFQPADVTVEQGGTVTWINNASRSMWVGSNDHPVHTKYSGTSRSQHCEDGDQTSAAFDQCSTGDRFSFTFEKTGEWGYHNHQPFVPGGTVTVR
jgi:plastocyanin